MSFFGDPDEFLEKHAKIDAEIERNKAEKSNFSRGISSATDNMQASAYGAGGLLADLVGLDSVRDAAFEGYQRNIEEAKLNPLDVPNFTDIDSAGDVLPYLSGVAGSLIPSIVEGAASTAIGTAIGGVAGGGFGAVAGKKVLKDAIDNVTKELVKKKISKELAEETAKKIVYNKAKSVGAKTGLVSGVGAVEAGGMYGQDAEKHGIDNANPISAAVLGGASGASELISPFGTLLTKIAGVKQVGSKVANEVADKFTDRLKKEIPKGMSGEFGQEVFQTFLGNLNEKVNDPTVSLTDREAIKGYLNSGIAGAIGGLGFGGAHALYGPDAKGVLEQDQEEQERKAEEVRLAEQKLKEAKNVDEVFEAASVIKGSPEYTTTNQDDINGLLYNLYEPELPNAESEKLNKETGEVTTGDFTQPKDNKEQHVENSLKVESSNQIKDQESGEIPVTKKQIVPEEVEQTESNVDESKPLTDIQQSVLAKISPTEPTKLMPSERMVADSLVKSGHVEKVEGRYIAVQDETEVQLSDEKTGQDLKEKDVQTSNEKTDYDYLPTLKVMVQRLSEGDVERGGYDENGDSHISVSTNPSWIKQRTIRKYNKENGTNIKVTKKDVALLEKKVREGKKLTPRQSMQFDYLKHVADNEMQNDQEVVAGDEYDKLTDEGFEFNAPKDIPVGNLEKGDEVIIDKGGIPDKLVHKGYDKNGDAILQDGITLKKDAFDVIEVIGEKQPQPKGGFDNETKSAAPKGGDLKSPDATQVKGGGQFNANSERTDVATDSKQQGRHAEPRQLEPKIWPDFTGREWQSKNGKRKVLGQSESRPEGWLEVETEGRRFNEVIHKDDIQGEIERDVKNFESYQKTKQQIEDDEKTEARLKVEREDVDGFDSEMSPVSRGRVVKALNKQIKVDGEILTRKQHVKNLIANGNETSTREENKVKPMSRRSYFRADQRTQDAHDKKIKAAGKKTVYSIGNYDVTKTEYDYAKYLQQQDTPDKAVTTETEQPPTVESKVDVDGVKFSKNVKKSTEKKLKVLSKKWSKKIDTIFANVRDNGDIALGSLIVGKDNRKSGLGSNFMEELTALADAEGSRIVLSPGLQDDRHGTTSRTRLIKFYKRFGFKENKGRNKDFTVSEGMIREPSVKFSKAHNDNFENWFDGSVVVDEDGNPLLVKHGTRAEVTDEFSFDFDKIGDNGRSEGAGFYFTTNDRVASGYGEGGTVLEGYLHIEQPLRYDAESFDYDTLEKIVKRVAEIESKEYEMDIEDGFLSNYGDARYDGLDSVISEAANLIADEETALDQIGGIVGSGVNPEHVNLAVQEITGYDGIIAQGFGNSGADVPIYVAFFPEQFKSVDNVGTWDKNDKRIYHSQKAPKVAQSDNQDIINQGLTKSNDTTATDTLQSLIGNEVTITPWALPDNATQGESGRGNNRRESPRGNFDLAENLSSIFGKKVVWITADGIDVNGIAVPKHNTIGDKIFIDVRSEVPTHAILGHELLHHLKEEHPRQYAELEGILEPLIKDADKYASLRDIDLPINEINEEIIADLLGDSFTDSSFWLEVAAQSPGKFKKIAAKVRRWINKLIRKVKSQGFGSDEYVSDLSATRDALAKFIAQAGTVNGRSDLSEKAVGMANVMNSKQVDTFKPVDKNSKEFKEWFGDSKVVDENGEPLRVYHGTNADIKSFDAGHRGTWLTSNPSLSNEYNYGRGGRSVQAYVSMKNPLMYEAHGAMWNQLEFEDEIMTTDDIADIARERGYDGVIIKNVADGDKKYVHGDTYAVFSPTQIKSAISNTGQFSPTDPRIKYSTSKQAKGLAETYDERNPPPIGLEEDPYSAIIKDKKNFKSRAIRRTKATINDILGGVDKFLGASSTRLKNISPKIEAKFRKLDFDTNTLLARDIKAVQPLLEKAKGMSRDDFIRWDFARKNSDVGVIDELIRKYNMRDEYNAYREVLNRLRDEANHVGMDISWIKDYAPRVIKDAEGFLKATMGTSLAEERHGVISKALSDKAKKLGLDNVAQLTPEMKADVVSNMLFGGFSGMTKPGNAKERTIDFIPPHLNQYYMDSDAALMFYLRDIRKHVEIRNFFGKIPKVISQAKSAMHQAQSRLRKAQEEERERMKKTDPFVTSNTPIQDTARITGIKDTIAQYRSILDKYKNERDYSDNIADYIIELMNDGTIPEDKPELEQKLVDIMKARFHERGTRGTIQMYKNFSYIDTMGSYISAITQIGDLAWTIYENGWVRSLKGVYKSATKSSRITKEDVGIERIAQEFADTDTLSKSVATLFKWVGLEKMDAIGKESFLNAALDKYEALAQSDPEKLKIEVNDIFENETDSLINDLQNKRITDNVKLLVYSKLLDYQPAGLSEMPEQYLLAGNGRIFYMLKSYTLKQFDVFRREVYNGLKNGNKKERIDAMKRLVYLSSIIVLANGGADEIKDKLLGRDGTLEDRVVDNILRLFGVSKYVTWKARTEGIGSALVKQILPPFKFIDSVAKDVATAGDGKGLNVTGSIPIVGKLAYWHMGKGADSKLHYTERRFSLEKSRLEKIEDIVQRKPSLRSKHRRELRLAVRFKKMRAELNKGKARINKLKAIQKETGRNLSSRIKMLEEQRIKKIEHFLK